MLPLTPDADQFRSFLRQRGFSETWHFAPLACVPSILYHDGLFSILEMDRRGFKVPARASRDDDIERGVGDFVKLSTMPYWKMLGRLMREGRPHAFIRFTNEPVFVVGTTFGDRNVWENGWVLGDSYEFARDYVFVRKPQWRGESLPEIYIPRMLPLSGYARGLFTCLREDLIVVEECLSRLGITSPVRLSFSGPSFPFPLDCHEAHLKSRGRQFAKVQRYLRELTIDSLRRGVEIEDDD